MKLKLYIQLDIKKLNCIVRNHFHRSAKFQNILPRLTLEKEANRWKIAKNGHLYDWLLPWQQSTINSYEQKRNPRCVADIHWKFQGLKPRGETNSSFLVLHSSSGEDTVNTVGSHLKWVFVCFLFKFYIWLWRLSSKKVENNSTWFLNRRAEENLVVNNKDNRVFLSRNYRHDSCPLEIRCS